MRIPNAKGIFNGFNTCNRLDLWYILSLMFFYYQYFI